MTEQQIRQKVVDTFKGYAGAKKGSAKHKQLIDIYNAYKPLPGNYRVTYTDAWCAASASAIAIMCGLTDIIPVECSCNRQITLWQKLGRWIEDESMTPKIGMYCYYDWNDGTNYAKTDNKGTSEHVGIVVAVNGNKFTVLEGNKGNESIVGYRDLAVNARYLRGFGDPNYASKVSASPAKAVKISTTSVKMPILKKGIEHSSVKLLQTMLNSSGFDCGTPDGSFGPKTESAVKALQKASGLAQDGQVGTKTWAAIMGV